MKFLYLIIFLFITTLSFGQSQLKEDKVYYVDSDKIYWNKALPIYITLSSPSLEGVQLEKPFYLDTEGINFIRTKWEMDSTGKYVYPFGEQIWEIYADGIPPKSKIKFHSTSSYVFRGKKYYSDDLKVEIIATDNSSGVDKIYYSINEKNFTLYNSFIIFEVGIDIDLKFYAVDNVGNIENIEDMSYNYDNNSLNFGIDNTPPETFVEKTNLMLSPKDVITLTSTDINGVGVNATYYNFDSTKYIKYTSPIKLNGLSDGEHKLNYFGIDWINNKENEKVFGFYLDANPPDIFVNEEIINEELTSLRKITLTVTDNKSGVKEILVQLRKDEEFKEYTKSFFVDIGNQELKIKAIDMVGNVSIRIVKYNEIK